MGVCNAVPKPNLTVVKMLLEILDLTAIQAAVLTERKTATSSHSIQSIK